MVNMKRVLATWVNGFIARMRVPKMVKNGFKSVVV